MMFEDWKNQLSKWNQEASDRRKLQLVYLVIIVASFFAAGVVSLMNQHAGMAVLKVTVVAIVVFTVNAVTWALLHTFLLSKLDSPRRAATRKR